jgi:hypothetical protein
MESSKLDKLKIVKKHFEDNKIPMGRINDRLFYTSVRHARGKISFIIGFTRGEIIHCDYEGGKKFDINWFNKKKELLEEKHPELEISIKRGTRNENKIRMVIEISQNNYSDNLLTVFHKTKETMEFEFE